MPPHPASCYEASNAQRHWVENEFRTLDLGDPRRVRRLKRIAFDLLAQPGASIPRASGDWAGAKGARNRQPAGQKESRKWLQSATASAPPVAAPWSVAVPRRPGQKAPTATLAIRCTQVRFAPPAHQAKYRGQTGAITAVRRSSERWQIELWRGLQRLHDISLAGQIFTKAPNVVGNAWIWTRTSENCGRAEG